MAGMQLGAALRHIHRLFDEGAIAGLADAQLLDRFRDRRDEAAFAALVDRHGPMVLATCRAVLRDRGAAEDVFQATFLLLARRAALIRDGAALGGWLHRVARRVAVRANADAGRRRRRERRAGLARAAGRENGTSPGELEVALHEEIDRLPDRHRLPVVLCHLEGLPHAQAARQLRWSERTLRRRLAEARERLRSRLSRRGVAIPAGALAAALAREASAVPTTWAEVTYGAATGGASARAAALAKGVLKAMLLAKLKTAASVALAITAMILIGTLAIHPDGVGPDDRDAATAPAESAPPPPPSPPPPARVDQVDEGKTLEIAGRVLDPEGRPFAGAKVIFQAQKTPGRPSPAGPPRPVAHSGPDGRFRFRIAEPGLRFLQQQAYRNHPTVAALADGYGPGWVSFTSADEAEDVTLRLVRDDVPIVGRVLDLEGRPVAGVTVIPLGIGASPDESLDAWERSTAKARDNRDETWVRLRKSLDGDLWAHGRGVTTGVDGRFRLTGIGRERVVSLKIEGPTMVPSFGNEYARTRPGPTYRIPLDRNAPEYGTLVFHGAAFDYAAAPTRPIVGTVRDKDAGTPLAGVTIRSDRFAGNIVSGRDHVRATTDADGRYRLVGMPGGSGNAITANPAPGQPYLGAAAEVPGDTGPAPATVDFALKRGVAIRGRVTDRATGAPVRAEVQYFAFLDNPHLAEARGLHGEPAPTRDDGTFDLVGLPGRGLVAVRADEDRYLNARGADAIGGTDEHGDFPTDPYYCDPEQFHTIVAIDPAAGADPLTCDVALDRGRTVRGTVLDPDGRPLAGAGAAGLNAVTMSPTDIRLPTAEFTAIGLDPGRPRPIFFRHEDKHLAAVLVLRGDEPVPPTVRLRPSATVTGRLVDADGNPRAGFAIPCNVDPKPFGLRFLSAAFYLRPTVAGDGRFRVEGLVPGVAYHIDAWEGRRIAAEIARGLTLGPGEARDLGDIRAESTSTKPPPERAHGGARDPPGSSDDRIVAARRRAPRFRQ
jgi:RNA polymerase sigma factor (sigma-70 family)